MSKPKIHFLSLFAAFLLTIAMAVSVFLINYFNVETQQNFSFLVFVFILIVNYTMLELLLKFYAKKQIKKISKILPENLNTEEEIINFKDLGAQIQKNVIEIDYMKDMETYRKEYLGNVSHELKTPLFSIQGYIETLKDGAIEDLEIRDKYIDRIGYSVERLLNIVKDLDMINQYEIGEISLNMTSFDLKDLVLEIFDLLEIKAKGNNAKLIFKANIHQIWVYADKQKISQVLINLISNAIYYSNRENAIISVNCTGNKTTVAIEVEDNGMGIKKEYLSRIFERFFRIEFSRNRRDGGSGLGLSIVKHILEAHNQKIMVSSVYLEGTIFSFNLNKSHLN